MIVAAAQGSDASGTTNGKLGRRFFTHGLADQVDGDAYDTVLLEDLLTDHPGTLVDPACDLRVEAPTAENVIEDRLVVGRNVGGNGIGLSYGRVHVAIVPG
jgi:hypothetical protein